MPALWGASQVLWWLNLIIQCVHSCVNRSYKTSPVFEIKGSPCVHILAAGCMDFKPCAPGMCMNIPDYEYFYIELCVHEIIPYIEHCQSYSLSLYGLLS